MPNKLLVLLDYATAQQDYAWFCVLLAWLAGAGLIYLRWAELRRNRARLGWLLPTLLGGAALAGAELIMHAWPPDPPQAERIGWDRWLSAALLIQTAALLPWLAARAWGRNTILAILAVGLVGVWLLRGLLPVPANTALAAAALVLSLAGALTLRKQSGRSPWEAAALLAAGCAPLLSTTGLLSELCSQQRRWTELSQLGVPSALLQFVLAGFILASLRPNLQLGSTGDPLETAALRRMVRTTLAGLAGWLLFGLLVSWWTGRAARRAYEENLVARARAAAALVNPADVLPVVGPGFKLEGMTAMIQSSGRRNPLARAPYLATVHRPIGDSLSRIELANPDINWAHLMTLRGGYLVTCAFSTRLSLARDTAPLHHAVTADDLVDWSRRDARFDGLKLGAWGELVRVRAPVIHPQAGMLGWIALDLGASDWTAAQAMARLQSFALIGAGVVVLLLGVLQRVRSHEHEIARQQAEQARAADRAKTAFLAKVSHELRTPVQSILGYSELLANLTLATEPARWLGSIRSQGQLLIRLVNDLLDLSAMQAGAFRLATRPANLAQLVRSCADSLRPRAAARGLELFCETDAGLPPWLNLDPDRVRQVLLNLLGNAIKFTDTGEVRLRLRFLGYTGEPDPGRVARVALVVRDTGPGIPPEQQESLFRPFTRLRDHADREGAGLGLALSAALCRTMQGRLSLASDGLHGSEFTAELAFPTALPPLTPAGETAAAPVVSLSGLRVLIADDNALVRELYVTSLRAAGVWCETAADGLEAVERCANEPFDVVVLDISMPWLDGMESARRIRAHTRAGLRIIGVSAHAGVAEREMALAAGMDAFLVKPVGLGDLLAAVAGGQLVPAVPGGEPVADLELLRRLRTQFAIEAPRLLAELAQSAASGDRHWLTARAHHLKNSADVTGYADVSLLCGRILQLAAISGEGTGAELRRLVDELGRLLRRPAPSFSSTTPDDSNNNP